MNVLQVKEAMLSLFAMLVPLLASAQTKVEINGIWYNLIPNGKAAKVTFKGSSSTEYKEYSGSITIPATVIHEGMDYNVTSIESSAFGDCSGLTSITIPESVTSIQDRAFANCYNLTAITFPENSQLTSIGEGTFVNCRNLTSITIPESVASIEWLTFEECLSLTSIIIPENSKLTSIEWEAFLNCSSLTSITIPKSVTSIGDTSFFGCSSLTSIIVADGNTVYDSRGGCNAIIETSSNILITGCSATTIPEGVTSIGKWAFYGHSSFTSITIPKSVTSIGEHAFSSCSGLTSITIPESITSIGQGTFSNCNNLTTIILPKSLKSIDSGAFASCEGVLNVYCHAEEVPSTRDDVFKGSYSKYATLHVPSSALNAYKTTAPWSSFGTIVALEGTEPLEKCATPTISYVDGEVVLACETEEATIISETSETTERIAGNHNSLNFTLIPSYTITSYAMKANYENSDVATLTLCWIPCTEEHESEETGTLTIPSKPVLIQSQGGTITLSGLAAGTEVTAYDLAGRELATGIASNGSAELATGLEVGSTAIMKIGNNNIKVIVK